MKNQIITLPNVLSLLRILLIFPIFFLIQRESYIAAFFLTAFAISTDFIDGYIARKTNTVTSLGAILDPVADKLVVLCLLWFFTVKGLLNPYYFALAGSRDILQLLAIPILLGYKRIHFKVIPKLLPKLATSLKFIVILTLFSSAIIQLNTSLLLWPILILSAALEVYILFTYIKRFTEIFKGVHDTFE